MFGLKLKYIFFLLLHTNSKCAILKIFEPFKYKLCLVYVILYKVKNLRRENVISISHNIIDILL